MHLESVRSSSEVTANESSSARKAHAGGGSDRTVSAACASGVKKASATARRMGTARQLPPRKTRSRSDGWNACRISGASTAA